MKNLVVLTEKHFIERDCNFFIVKPEEMPDFIKCNGILYKRKKIAGVQFFVHPKSMTSFRVKELTEGCLKGYVNMYLALCKLNRHSQWFNLHYYKKF